MTSKRRLLVFRLVIILAALAVGLGVYSPISAQEETPPPPPVPTDPVEIAPAVEPSPTTLPSETPAIEPSPTLAPPTETATLEPTAAPPTETPIVEPTLETTAEATTEPTLAPTLGVETATPESSLVPESTDEATAEVTPEFITATPEFFVTEEATPLADEAGDFRRGTRVEPQLLELASLVEEGQTAQAQSFAASMELEMSASAQTVHVEVVAADEAEALRLRPAIERLGGSFLIGYERRMEFSFPIDELDALDRTSGSFGVLRPREATPLLGPRLSEGVQATGAFQWHQRGIDGSGVRVGVIDSGFRGHPSAETTGCAQAISNFAAGTTLISEGNHGANVVQIVCDMAPKAHVFVAQVNTLSSLNAAVDWLIAQNVNVVNMSLGWDFAGAGDGTGEVNMIVQRLADNGILLFNAAGNENNSVWHGDFDPITWPEGSSISIPFGGTGQFLNFGGGGPTPAVNRLYNGQPLNLLGCAPGQGASVAVTLRWSDWNLNRTGNASNQDFDLHLYFSANGGATWTFLDASAAPQDSADFLTPVESLGGVVPCYLGTTPLTWGVAVECFDAFVPCGAPYMQLIASRGGFLEFQTAGSSLTSPADSQNVMAVAAGEVKPYPNNGWPFSPFGYPDLAIYSSRGPILGDGGTAPGGAPYTKPDLTAPTNTTTSLDVSFNGTSAASPHAAGFAALVYQINRATYDGLSGLARMNALKDDMLDVGSGDFIRPVPASSARTGCGGANVDCFGQGIITADHDFFAFTDAKMEHTDGRVTRSGANWIQQTQTGASGSSYVYTKDFFPADGTETSNYAQVEFGVQFATGVQVFYWQRPDLVGNLEVLLDGNPVGVSGTTALTAGTPTLVSFTLNLAPTVLYDALSEITIRPAPGANGLSLDYVQLLHDIPTFQENELSTFGTWRRTALANTSGGFHATNNQPGAGVQFYTDAAAFTITYTKQPNGGVMEIWVNGQRCTVCGEVNAWSGTTMTSPQAVHYVSDATLSGAFGAPPYFVQLVNSGRQTPATAIRPYITIDNIRFPLGGSLLPAVQGLEAETGYNGQASSQFLPMNGVWRNMPQASAFGGRIYNTTTPGAEFRFKTQTDRNVVYFTGLTTGALLDIYVNGQLCTACGTIDTYRPTTMYRVPYVLNIPGGPSTYSVTLRNSGNRSSGAGLTATMAIDRIEALDGNLGTLDLFNVQGDDAGGFWINERWVANRQLDAIGGDVYINNSAFGGIWFNTCSADFTLLLGKNRDGGIVRVKIWDGAEYDTLAEFNGQATSTLWRSGLNVTFNPASYPACTPGTPYQMLIEVDANTQFGNRLDYGYLDALLINDSGALFGWGYTPQETIEFGDPKLVEVGAGWATFPQIGAIGDDVRRTNQTTGRSIQFTIQDSTPLDPNDNSTPRLIFSRAPDGGIAEVYVNGVFQFEISFYSPVVLPQQFLPITIPADTQYPAVVELRNVPRRTIGSTNSYLYIDAVIETSEPTGFGSPVIGTGIQNDDNTRIQLFGSTWIRSNASTTIFPSGSNVDTTTANSGGLRFVLTGGNRFTFTSSVSANRGLAEIWVNGRLCTACGAINTFSRQTFWQTPFLVEIPTSLDADPGAGQLYYVEIHTTNMRPVGASGFGLSADEIIPLGGTLVANTDPLWTDNIVDGQLPGGFGYTGPFTTVNSAFAYGGSYRKTTVAGTDYSFDQPVANDELIVLRNTARTGGIAEIWIWDEAIQGYLQCFECGTIDSYSPYTRYQVPFYFQIPSRFTAFDNETPGDTTDDYWLVHIVNTSTRSAGSTGFELSLDAFIVLP